MDGRGRGAVGSPTAEMVDALADEARRAARILALQQPATYGDRRLECDLVMKGGITSGVVYPLAVAELATTYRFRNLGGTSAGAIAAAATAAASMRPDGAGFAALAGLPARLGTELGVLFRPQRRCRRLHRVMMAAIDPGAARLAKVAAALPPFLATISGAIALVLLTLPAVAVGVALREQIAAEWMWALLWLPVAALGAVAAVGRGASWARATQAAIVLGGAVSLVVVAGWDPLAVSAVFAIALVGIIGAVVVGLLANAVAVLPDNDFGLVGGSSLDTKPAPTAPLTEWLDDLIQELAGRDADDRPLTFADLHEVGINLTLLSTCLSTGRTYYLPNDTATAEHDTNRFYFDPFELRRSLPDRVVAFLCEPDNADARSKVLEALTAGKEALPGAPEQSWLSQALWPLRPLPAPEHLPVVMATRMSLSFPLLIAAVPLRRVDWTRVANRDARRQWRQWSAAGAVASARPQASPDAEHCWFSDGGIISNFPVHLFDAALPSRPTFGINLREFHPDRIGFAASPNERDKVYRPATNSGGISEWWTRWAPSGVKALTGFAGALKSTVQNWSDNDQMRVPGYRDRVVHVSQAPGEGGLNLSMSAPTITSLSRRGHAAAEELISAFADPGAAVVTNWRNHRWVRLRSTLSLLAGSFAQIDDQHSAADPVGTPSYADLLRQDTELAPSYKGTEVQRAALIELIEGAAPDGPPAAGPGILGASAAIAERTARHATAAPWYQAPGPAPRLRIVPGHDDGSREGPSGSTGAG